MTGNVPELTDAEREQTRYLLKGTDPFGRLQAMAEMLLWLGPAHVRNMHKMRDRFEAAQTPLTPPPPADR